MASGTRNVNVAVEVSMVEADSHFILTVSVTYPDGAEVIRGVWALGKEVPDAKAAMAGAMAGAATGAAWTSRAITGATGATGVSMVSAT